MFTRRLPGEIKKRAYRFVADELLLIFKMELCVEQRIVYFTVIGQVFHELWQFETTHANARNLRAVLIYLFQIQVSGLCGFKG